MRECCTEYSQTFSLRWLYTSFSFKWEIRPVTSLWHFSKLCIGYSKIQMLSIYYRRSRGVHYYQISRLSLARMCYANLWSIKLNTV